MLTLRMFNLNINKYKCTDKIEEIISNENKPSIICEKILFSSVYYIESKDYDFLQALFQNKKTISCVFYLLKNNLILIKFNNTNDNNTCKFLLFMYKKEEIINLNIETDKYLDLSQIKKDGFGSRQIIVSSDEIQKQILEKINLQKKENLNLLELSGDLSNHQNSKYKIENIKSLSKPKKIRLIVGGVLLIGGASIGIILALKKKKS